MSKSPSSESVQVRTPSPTIEHRDNKSAVVDEPPKIVVSNDYDEDFSQESATPDRPPVRDIEIEIESIHEDIESKHSHRSSSSTSTADEQSEILVLVKKSASNTPRQSEDEKSSSIVAPIKLESDDDHTERDNQINQLTETFIRTFIDEAIDQGKEIEHQKIKSSVTKEASEWMSDEDLSDDENVKQIPITHEEDVENAIEKLSTQPEFLEQLDTTTNGTNDHEELKLDLSPLEERTRMLMKFNKKENKNQIFSFQLMNLELKVLVKLLLKKSFNRLCRTVVNKLLNYVDKLSRFSTNRIQISPIEQLSIEQYRVHSSKPIKQRTIPNINVIDKPTVE